MELPDGFGAIAPAAANDQMKATKVFLLDVREASELTQNGYVEGSVNIPTRTVLKNLDKLPAKLEALKPGLPKGVKIVIAYDRSDLISQSVRTASENLIEELIVVGVLIIGFLLHMRSALIPIITSAGGYLPYVFMGSLVFGVLCFVPLVLLSNMLVRKYREQYE